MGTLLTALVVDELYGLILLVQHQRVRIMCNNGVVKGLVQPYI
jgi:hypothetical protein